MSSLHELLVAKDEELLARPGDIVAHRPRSLLGGKDRRAGRKAGSAPLGARVF